MISTACRGSSGPLPTYNLGEGQAPDVFHGDEMPAALFADSVDRDDTGVVQACYGARLALEALHEFGVLRKVARKDLQRYSAFKRSFPRLVDNPHPPAAQFPQDFKLAQSPL